MTQKNDTKITSLLEGYNTRLNNLADMIDKSEDEVADRIKTLDFRDYVDLMRTLRDFDEDKAKEILGYVDEAYSTGGTLSPSEMRSSGATQKQTAPSAGSSVQKKAQAMQKLGKKNLGGQSAQQTAKAMDQAEQGKTLNPQQKKAMAAQAMNMDKLASDPKTAAQFRSLLNRINK